MLPLHSYVGVTDNNWYRCLSSRPDLGSQVLTAQ
jgi:hypothetical protein